MLRSGSLLMILAMLSGCGSAKSGPEPESVEECKDRFKNPPAIGSAAQKLQFDFTYQLPNDSKYMKQSLDQRAQITASDGLSEQMVKQFLSGPVFPKGSYLFAKDLVLNRVPGPSGDWSTAVAIGCSKAPPGSRLYHVNAFSAATGSGSS